jgi:hypothetical protein
LTNPWYSLSSTSQRLSVGSGDGLSKLLMMLVEMTPPAVRGMNSGPFAYAKCASPVPWSVPSLSTNDCCWYSIASYVVPSGPSSAAVFGTVVQLSSHGFATKPTAVP